jgi:NDP-sugar pyrophosphorylase family protein
MILAAGLGTRLRPLTDVGPKALVEVGGITLLERTIRRLAETGCDRVVLNLHHHADRVVGYLEEHAQADTDSAARNFRWHGTQVVVSREVDAPLQTGGGILHAAALFRPGEAILVHNVDVISDVDLPGLVETHHSSDAVATLAVSRRDASRYLVFDGRGLCGRVDERTGSEDWARTPGPGQWRAGFAGVHTLSAGFPSLIEETGAFSIVRTYLRLAASGHAVRPYDVTGALWYDVGTPERLAAARARWPSKGA